MRQGINLLLLLLLFWITCLEAIYELSKNIDLYVGQPLRINYQDYPGKIKLKVAEGDKHLPSWLLWKDR